MRYPPEALEEIRARLPLSTVISRKVKLKRRGHEWLGLSPFNKERTPSFSVNDTKGLWHDWSSGKGGDIFSFVQETERISFCEAVERLAHECGISLETDPHAVAREKKRLSLIGVCEYAARFFASNLPRAKAYVTSRGLSPHQIQEYQIGYAPPDRQAFKARLASDGVDLAAAVEVGLVVSDDDVQFDRFRNRLIFPIHDQRGRVIGFGGRALDNSPAKYLNSPESPLFHKSQILYNHHRAKDGDVVVVEGYFDCLASCSCGFRTVATMGTAISETHLRTLWRISDTPTICFDADQAGQRAIRRAMELAFPMLIPGRSLKFALLTRGDPDSLVRENPENYRTVISAALGLMDMLWRASENYGTGLEDRAKLEKELCDLAGSIRDDNLRRKYLGEIRKRVNALNWQPKIHRSNGYSHHSTSPGSIRLAHIVEKSDFRLRDAVYLAAVLAAPDRASPERIAADEEISPRARGIMCEVLSAFALGEQVRPALQQEIDRALVIVQQAGIKTFAPREAEKVLREHI